MGLENLYSYFASYASYKDFLATDYMLETMLFVYYLLFIYTFYLFYLKDVSGRITLLSSQNNNTTISHKLMSMQSAENCKGFSETTRQLPDYKFWSWFAGVIDGNGNFDIRLDLVNKTKILKQIRIKLHNKDLRILTRIQNCLHIGRIRADKNKPYSIYIVSNPKDVFYIIKNVNGLIKLKVPCFKEACGLYKIKYKESNYEISPDDSYFAGLIDTKGKITFNYDRNTIECGLDFKYNDYTSKLNFNSVIKESKPKISKRRDSSNPQNFKFITFQFKNVGDMLFIYNYFMKHRLYCDMKFYRISKIKLFTVIRKYKKSKVDLERKIYCDFLIDWFKYDNPLWYKVPCVKQYLLYK
uniref:LAGLIDADG endonuclease n=1 Tax=Metarhizium rileyi (strain RCEF 4871) TaxID=1649241 RepID=A0A6H0B868_METRR|nr:LAGLIDADG endonuclease [Metarhizium rileyi]QIS49105.1 LAGLIDADG endonuclease [Metarhizium rileyi]